MSRGGLAAGAILVMAACGGQTTDVGTGSGAGSSVEPPPSGGSQGSSGGATSGGGGGGGGGGTVGSVSPPSVGAEVQLQLEMYDALTDVVVVGNRVVFETLGANHYGYDSAIWSMPKAGGAATAIAEPASLDGAPVLGPFTTDDASLFYAYIIPYQMPVGIYTTDIATGAPATPVVTGVRPWSLAVDATSLVWTEGPQGDVKLCAKTSCTPALVAAGPGGGNPENGPQGKVALDSTNVYVGYNSGVLASAPLAPGGALTVLTTWTSALTGIMLDATNVYATDATGAVLACAKAGCPGGFTVIAQMPGARSLSSDGSSVFWLADRGGVWSWSAVDGVSSSAWFVAGDGDENALYQPPRALAVDPSGFFYGGDGLYFRARK